MPCMDKKDHNYYLQIDKKIQICEQNTTIYYDIKTPSIKADLNTM